MKRFAMALCGVLMTSAASAHPVTINFTGTFSAATGSFASLLNTTYSGSFTFDDELALFFRGRLGCDSAAERTGRLVCVLL